MSDDCDIEQFLYERMAGIKATIIAYETAHASISADDKASYQLDTGQTRILVTRHNLTTLENAIKAQYNLLSTIQARVCGGGQTRIVPGW